MSPLRVLVFVSLALLAVAAVSVSARPLFDGGVMQPARVSAPLMRFMQSKSLAAAKASASVEGPWFAEVSWAADVAKLKPELRTFKDFAMDHEAIKTMLKDLLAVDGNGKPTSKWYAMNWKKAKLTGGDDLLAFKKYRATFVQAIAFLVKVAGGDPCPYCMVRGSGSEDPGSDIDLAAVGWGANQFVRSFNTLFETVWPQGQTAAEVFDVNVYADCWVWPKSANVNLKDEESKSKADKAASAVNLLMSRAADGQEAEKIPLCFTEQKMNDDDVYVYTVQKADAAADEKNQRVWALVHWIYYKLEDLYHHVAAVPIECTLHASAKIMTEKCATIEKLFQGGSSEAAKAYNADFSAAVAKLLSLAQSPCAAFAAYCSKPPPAATQSYSPAVMMHNIKNRNSLNFEALDRLYKAIDPAVPASKQAAAAEAQNQYCLKSKDLMSEAAWWSQEAYLTKGAINHVVHSGQAGAAISWISRSEFFDSFLENYGDFQKEVAHDHQPGPAAPLQQRVELGEAFTVKASKYISRMFDSHHRIKKAANGVSQNAQTFSTCAFPPVYVLQKQVRNKVSNAKIVAASKCAVKELLACVKSYTQLPAATVVLENDILVHAVNMFAREVITHFYSGYVAGEANNKAVALEKDEGLFTPSQCTIR